MTIIAWDGQTLAADKQSTSFGNAGTATKIHRIPSGIVGFTGNAAHAMSMLKWFKDGCLDGKFPKPANRIDDANAIFISWQGEIRSYAGSGAGQYEVREDRFVAAGCGRDYALAAMHLGKSALEAVEVACALDVFCGMGIDTLTLDT